MDTKEFIKILHQPSLLKNEHLFELEEFIQHYPYFQAAKVLYLKALKEQNSFRYNQNLKTTAIYTSDRSVLFDFITSEVFHNPIAQQEEKEIIKEIELRDEIIIEKLQSPEEKEELLEFDLPKNALETETSDSEESTDDLLASIHSEQTQDFETFEKEMDEKFASFLLTDYEKSIESVTLDNSLDEIDENKNKTVTTIENNTDEITESLSEINDETEATRLPQELMEDPDEVPDSPQDSEETTIISQTDENSLETIEQESPKEIEDTDDSATKIIDKAFIYKENLNTEAFDTPLENTIKEKKKKHKILPTPEIKEPLDLSVSDSIYRSILKDPKIYDQDFSIKSKSNTVHTTKHADFIFEIATDEAIEKVHANINPSSEETTISPNQTEKILFEPITLDNETTNLLTKKTKDNTEPLFSLDNQKPVHFTKNESHSFSEWMQLSSFKPIDRSTEPLIKEEKKEKMAIIEEFIKKNPKKIKPSKIAGFSVDFDQVEKFDNDSIMTETLAQVYTEQHKYDSAIKAYEILSLKFPEKSSFFADQIKMLKDLKKKHSSK